MAYDIGPKIGIDGEREFRQSINQITTEMKTLSTEMKVVTSEFADNADSQEALTRKNQVLSKQVETQTKKLSLLSDGLQKCSEKYGEADTKTLKWKQAVNQAQAVLNDLQGELADNIRQISEFDSEVGDASEEIEDFGTSIEKASEGFSVVKGAMADLAADGIKSIASGMKDMVAEVSDASTTLQGQTGATTEEMKKYNDIMQEIYSSGYGDSLEQVAESLSKVKQQVGDIEPEKLKDMTKYALDLEQTFGFDVSESIRTANQLMEQFGISGEKAYDLIVAGAQNGLNQNDNLLDTYNEYSPKFKQIGFDADDMYNALISGADRGIFDIDKLGDAVNEFSIRVLDGSDTTKDAFSRLGLDAEAMADQFARGGDVAKNAFKQTVKALEKLEDPLEQNTVGVELFGTMWEDTGGEALLALADIEDGIDDTTGAMKKLDKVNTDNLNNKLGTLGRKIKTDVAYPIIEEAYPAIEKIIDYTAENLDEIIPLAKTAGAAIATIFVVNKASEFVGSIKNITSTIKDLTSETKRYSEAQELGNKVAESAASKMTKFAGGVGIAVGAYKLIADSVWSYIDETNQKIIEMQSISDEAMTGLSNGANAWIGSIESATGYLASFNDTLFTTAEQQNELTRNMQEVQNGITEICKIASEERRGYTAEEIQQLDQYFQKLNELQEQQYQVETSRMEAISQAAITYAQTQDTSFAQYQETSANWIATAQQQKDNMLALIDEQTVQEIALLNQRYGEQAVMTNTAYANDYNALIANSEQKKAAVNQNMSELYTAYANGYQNITDQTSIFNKTYTDLGISLEQEADMHVSAMNAIGQRYEEGTKEYQDAVDAHMEGHREIQERIWKHMIQTMDSAEASQLASWLQMVADADMNGAELDNSTQDMVNSLIETFGNLPEETKDTIRDTLQPMLEGLRGAQPDLYSAAESDADSVIRGIEDELGIHSPSRVMQELFRYVGEGAVRGMEDKIGDVKNAATKLAASASDNVKNYGLYNGGTYAGSNLAAGLAAGIRNGASSVINAAASLASSALRAAKNALGIHSPSKVFRDEVGKMAALGLEEGFDSEIVLATNRMIDEMQTFLEVPKLSEYKNERTLYNVTQVYLGDKELTKELSRGVIKEISHTQRAASAAKGRRS